MAATLSARQRASGLDRCGYSGGPAPEVRGRLFVLMADLRWLGRPACRSPETRRAGWPVRVLRSWSGPRCRGCTPWGPGTCRSGRGPSTPSGTGILPRPPAWNCRESGWKTWDASGPHSHKRPMSDKPDLSLVHLRGVQGSWILCGNRSTSYSRRRIPDRSGRPSVAVH